MKLYSICLFFSHTFHSYFQEKKRDIKSNVYYGYALHFNTKIYISKFVYIYIYMYMRVCKYVYN